MNILSLSPTHDSSVCVLVDGKLEFYCKEERITRIKKDMHPYASLALCLEKFKNKIDHFVYAPSVYEHDVSDRFHKSVYKMFTPTRYKQLINQDFQQPFNVTHHVHHAMLSYVNSKFDDALVFVIDRNGSAISIDNHNVARETESVYKFNKKGFRDLEKSYAMSLGVPEKHKVKNKLKDLYGNADVIINVNNTLGIVKVYEAATTLIGQHPLENGKTMGLSAYGQYSGDDKLFIGPVADERKFTYVNDYIADGVTCFVDDSDLITYRISESNCSHYANRAKQVQIETQEQVLNLIKKHVDKTGIKNVCLVGGYALNVVANNYYIKNLPDVNFYFEPNSDDSGVGIGAAMHHYFMLTGKMAQPLENNFYHYFDETEQISVGDTSDIDSLVDLLIAGKSLAIFQGNPEAGPRALGNRSILFDPRIKDAKKIVNQIKKREWYRPFAGVIIKSDFKEYFDNLGLEESPHMTINFDAKEKTKELVPGIIHVDGTCRIQTVQSGFLFELLSKFKEKTGCPMLLNTSFNLAGEPLVQTKKDAVETFLNSSLDAVYFVDDDKLIVK